MNIMDEIGKWDTESLNLSIYLLILYISSPIHTMTDSALVERYRDEKSVALFDVGLLCNMSS